MKKFIRKSFIKKIAYFLTCTWTKLRYPFVKIIAPNNALLCNVKISQTGGGNLIIIGKDAKVKKCDFVFRGHNNKVNISSLSNLQHVTFWIEDDNNTIDVGEGTTTDGKVQLAACEGCTISIGKDCMFSHDIFVRTTDSHSILYMASGMRFNKAQDVIIGNHVWVGMQSLILKGSVVGNNNIIAARSTVSRSTQPRDNCTLGGAPAKIIKEGVNWKRERA